jgi:hypothetical protein
LDIWVVRFAEHAQLKFHGLLEVAHCKTAEVLNTTKGVWFLDGVGKHRQEAIAAVSQRLSEVQHKEVAAIDYARLAALFKKRVGPGNPSSGWQGELPRHDILT